MADIWSSAKRSQVMGRIRSRNTKPELIVRSLLHRCGLRFSLRAKGLPGRPDIVLTRHRAVVFVHGCFWHRHPGCATATMPKSRLEYWLPKFARNVERDARSQMALQAMGWRVFVLWECQVMRDPAQAVRPVVEALKPGLAGQAQEGYLASLPGRADILAVAEERVRYELGQRDAGKLGGESGRQG